MMNQVRSVGGCRSNGKNRSRRGHDLTLVRPGVAQANRIDQRGERYFSYARRL